MAEAAMASRARESQYRAVQIGCGPRGTLHALAYRSLERMRMVGVADLDRNRAEGLAAQLGVPAFTDADEMLSKLAPDIVHVVTAARVPRAPFVLQAARAGAKVVVIEKPLAIVPSDFYALAEAVRAAGVKVIVCHQRRYFRNAQAIMSVRDRLGAITSLRANSQGFVMDMATHAIDFLQMFAGDMPPELVVATAWGDRSLSNPNLRGPDSLIAFIAYPNGIRASLEVSDPPLGTVDFERATQRCNVDVWATKGRAWIRQDGEEGWGVWYEGLERSTCGRTSFATDTADGQIRFTEAIRDWLDDEDKPHGCRFELAERGFHVLLMAFHSALYRRPATHSVDFGDDEWNALLESLKR